MSTPMSTAAPSNTTLLDYAEELKRLEEMEFQMLKMDNELKDALVKSDLLNLDIATMFDPEELVLSKGVVKSCEPCATGNEINTLSQLMAAAKDDFDLIADESAPNTPQQIVPNFTKKATTSSTKKAPASRKRPAPKKPAPKKKAFKAPFAPTTKALSSVEPDATPSGLTDASSTAKPPATPADTGNRGSSRKRKEPERFTDPVAVPKGNGFKDPITTKGKTPANKQAKDTPQNTPAKLKIKSEPQDDFDSLLETPLVELKTPVANAKQDDFDSLMVTPHDPTPAQIAIAASVKVKEEPLEACRTSRKRKQTKFFGSPVKDDQPQVEVSTAGLSKKVKTERRSNPIETIKPAPKKLTKEQMAENEKKQKAEFTRRLRSELCGPMFKDVLITVEHDPEVLAGADLLDFIPSLIQGRLSIMGRYWATDGEHFWVKPRPDPTPLIRGNMTNAEINAKRYMSPGPPVCPKMVIMLCEGRFPPDDMSVRICLTRKRNALKNRLREGERFKLMFQERYSKFFKDLVAAKDNAHVKQSDLVDKGINQMMHLIHQPFQNMTLHRYLLVKAFIKDILSVKAFGSKRLNMLVDMFMESIKEDVNDDIKTCDWSPGQCEDFKLEQFGFVGRNNKEHVNFMRLDHDMGPMSNFAPFFTRAEFELLYEDSMVGTDDDELTATFDNDGNKTGNREFRTIRELLTPFGSLPEDFADSAKHDDMVQWMHYKLYEEDHDKDYNPESDSESEYESESEEDAETIVDAKVAISTEVVESTVDSTKGTSPEGVEENIAEEEEAEFTDEEYESDEEGLETEVEELISSQQEYAKLNPEQKKKWEDIKAQTAQKD